MFVKCKSCGAEVLDRVGKCSACGASLVEETQPQKKTSCPRCTKEIPDFAAFCPFCGSPVSKQEPAVEKKPVAEIVPKQEESKQDPVLPVCGACGKEQFDNVQKCAFCGGNVLPPGTMVAAKQEQPRPKSGVLPTCRACGKELFDSVSTCPFCGAGVSVSVPGAENLQQGVVFVKCKNCGKEVPHYMDNCPKCKEPLVIDDPQLAARRDAARQVFQNQPAAEPEKHKTELTDVILIGLSIPVAIPALIVMALARMERMPTLLAVTSGFIMVGSAYYLDATWKGDAKPSWVLVVFFFLLFSSITGILWLVRRAMKE